MKYNIHLLPKIVLCVVLFFACSKNKPYTIDYSWAQETLALQDSTKNPKKSYYQTHALYTGQLFKFVSWHDFQLWFKKNNEPYIDKAIDALKTHINKVSAEVNFPETKNKLDKLKLIQELLLIQKELKEFNAFSSSKLKNAITDFKTSYGNQYNFKKYETKIDKISALHDKYKSQLASGDYEKHKQLIDHNKKITDLQKEITLSNPLLKGMNIVFTSRAQYAKDHHNTATLFHTNEINTNSFEPGAAMKILELGSGDIQTLIETKTGVVRDPEISFDGEKLIFSMRKSIEEDYSIYEYDLNRRAYKRLTNTKGVSDIDPLYLPDGQIIFTSTRNPKYCMCNVHIMGNLFKMKADGSDIIQIGNSSLFEGHSTLLDDGRILYDRWEYVDRNFGDAQGLWTVNPDGTNHAVYFGNNTNSPGGVIDARQIPGTQKVVCILGNCHDRPWGALAILDNRKAVDGKDAVERTWPVEAHNRIGKGNWDAFLGLENNYEDPFPLNEKYFLCSRTIGDREKMGLYLVDIFGNETLIHTEGKGCYNPLPIAKPNKPEHMLSRTSFEKNKGKVYVANVYEGTHMKGVKKGEVKYLRVVRSIEKKTWTKPAWQGQGVHRPAMNWHSFECKEILGTVDVEKDGSVYFEVPSDQFIYFQLLDKNHKMIQSMRSGTVLQPGEIIGCIGCHDDRRATPPIKSYTTPIAMTKEPQKLRDWYGKSRQFGFMREVQPIFDNKCVKCHDFGKKAGEKLNLASDRNVFFNASYIDLNVKGYVGAVGAGPAAIQEAKSWGSHTSKLVKVLENGHKGIKLSKEEMDRIYAWIDLNGVYYPTFASSFPDNPVGRSPLTQKEVDRLSELTGVPIMGQNGYFRQMRALLSFQRPHLSPMLKKLNKNSKEYRECIEILKLGNKRLLETPRADMENQKISDIDVKRLEKYARLKEEVKKSRANRLQSQK